MQNVQHNAWHTVSPQQMLIYTISKERSIDCCLPREIGFIWIKTATHEKLIYWYLKIM